MLNLKVVSIVLITDAFAKLRILSVLTLKDYLFGRYNLSKASVNYLRGINCDGKH